MILWQKHRFFDILSNYSLLTHLSFSVPENLSKSKTTIAVIYSKGNWMGRQYERELKKSRYPRLRGRQKCSLSFLTLVVDHV